MLQIELMRQHWRDLFFLHWSCSPDALQRTLPPPLRVDTFLGQAYIGIVFLHLTIDRPLGVLPYPKSSEFMEVNVRTYVYHEKMGPGIWFYSLDANHHCAVWGARFFFKLPYFYSRIHMGIEDECQYYSLLRKGTRTMSSFCLQHKQNFYHAHPNTLDHFLIERYRLYTAKNNTLYSLDIEHNPYVLASAQVHNIRNNLFALDHVPQGTDPSIHAVYSPGVDVKTYPLHAIK